MTVKNTRKTTYRRPSTRGKRGAFTKGQSGNPAGRPKGAVGKATAEAKAACALIVDNAVYRANLLKRAQTGKLAPAVETMLWYYAKGKPKERHQIEGSLSLVDLLAPKSEMEGTNT